MLAALLLSLSLAQSSPSSDAKATFPELCLAHGYATETHEVTTSDGYILTLFRIPGLLNSTSAPKPVVFMQHGLLDLADTFITNEPAPGFIMADAGFDVWFGNSRGSFHSMGHTSLNPRKDAAYWMFSWQQMADFDIPASIQYVLQATNQPKLSYIGHSQGCLTLLAHLSEHPEFAQNLNLAIMLAPVWTIRHLEVGFLKVLDNVALVDMLAFLGVHDFLPNPQTPSLFYYACSVVTFACDDVIGLVADMQVKEDNTERFPVILAHEPGGTSLRNMQHWQQMSLYSEYKLQKYDYGEKENMEVYGSKTPPLYNLQNIPKSVAMFFGSEDRLANPVDSAWLRQNFPPGSVVYTDDTLEFGHLTFVWGKDMSYFKTIIDLIKAQ